MEQHLGLKNYILDEETKLCCLGFLTINNGIDISLKIERTCNNFHIYFKNNSTKQLIWKTKVPICDNAFENCYKMIDKSLDYIHKNVKVCCQCGNSFGCVLNNTLDKYTSYGFPENELCCDCGLQRIYNKKFSDIVCSICHEPVGYGSEETSICNDPRHAIHSFCKYKLSEQRCPLCRIKENGSDTDTDTEQELSYNSESVVEEIDFNVDGFFMET